MTVGVKLKHNNMVFVSLDKSSTIKSASYDKTVKVMNVTFNNGSVYSYHGVSYNRFNAFVKSESVGAYFVKNIKGKFASTKRDFVISSEIVFKLSRSFR